MTDIGLPLARPAVYDLAGFGRHALRTIAPPAVAASLLFGGWELLSRNGAVSARLLPSPSKVFDTLSRSLGVLLEQAQPTFWGAVAGIVLAAALGILLGAAVSYSRTLMQMVYPTIGREVTVARISSRSFGVQRSSASKITSHSRRTRPMARFFWAAAP
jgi:hypothetical protein